jgi:hypothetical protein
MMFWKWRCFESDDIFKVTMFWKWRCFESDDVLKVMIFSKWRCFQSDDVFKVTMFSKWRWFQSDDVLKVTIFFKWRCFKSDDVLKKDSPEWTEPYISSSVNSEQTRWNLRDVSKLIFDTGVNLTDIWWKLKDYYY